MPFQNLNKLRDRGVLVVQPPELEKKSPLEKKSANQNQHSAIG
jgi:hypothetical protein